MFVHPGEYETFGQTLQEAHALGVPVIAPGRGGPIDLVNDGVDGFLFTPDDEASFIGALERVVADPAAAARIGRAGLARGEECFDPRRAVETYRKLIAGLAALPGSSG